MPIIKDKSNRLISWAANLIVEPWFLRHFASIKFYGDLDIKKESASLMLMNHYSYNDGILLNYISKKMIKKQLRAMVIDGQMKAFPALKYLGCFSVSKKSKEMIDSLNYSAELLKDPSVVLGIFPQGGLYSMHLNKIHFLKGLAFIFKRTKDIPYQIIFGVTLLDYLESFKPVARVYFKEYTGERDFDTIEEAYNHFYKSCKQQNQRLFNAPDKVIDVV